MCLEKSLASRTLKLRLKRCRRRIWSNRARSWPICCGTTREFKSVRREHLVEAGKRVRLKDNVKLLAEMLSEELDQAHFEFVVISAGPREVVQSALDGIVPPENVFGTEFGRDPSDVEIVSVERVPAGYGKVVVLQELEQKFGTRPDHTIYIGDGSSDLYRNAPRQQPGRTYDRGFRNEGYRANREADRVKRQCDECFRSDS